MAVEQAVSHPDRVLVDILNTGRKADDGKLRWRLVPWDALEQVVAVLEAGAKEYGDFNWQLVEPFEERYGNALLRHVVAWTRGEVADPKSGLPHLAHACCNALFLLAGPKRR